MNSISRWLELTLGSEWWVVVGLVVLMAVGILLLVFQRYYYNKYTPEPGEEGKGRLNNIVPKEYDRRGIPKLNFSSEEEKEFNKNMNTIIMGEQERLLDEAVRHCIPNEDLERLDIRLRHVEYQLQEIGRDADNKNKDNIRDYQHTVGPEEIKTKVGVGGRPPLTEEEKKKRIQEKKYEEKPGDVPMVDRLAAIDYFKTDEIGNPILLNLPRAQDYPLGFKVMILNRAGHRQIFSVSGRTRGPWNIVNLIKTTPDDWVKIKGG